MAIERLTSTQIGALPVNTAPTTPRGKGNDADQGTRSERSQAIKVELSPAARTAAARHSVAAANADAAASADFFASSAGIDALRALERSPSARRLSA